MSNFQSIGVIGAGAWGTALAQSSCNAGCDVTLWANEPETATAINETHENKAFLPGIKLSEALRATTDLAQMNKMDAILMVTPAQFLRSVALSLAPHLSEGKPVIICAKGIETSSSKLLSEVLSETIPSAIPVILSGPSFATDVAKGLPTAVTLAAKDEILSEKLSNALGHKALRPYWSSDLIGVQIGGAVKNVLAIAAGIVVGKNLGASAHASMVTRGFAELSRFAKSYGAEKETLMGLSGLGDLILTCQSLQSRNMSLGQALGEGKSLSYILNERSSVSEGVYTAAAVAEISKTRGIEMPIANAVAKIVAGKIDVDDAISGLLARPLRAENQ